MGEPLEISESVLWTILTVFAIFHAICTFLVTALREVSNARLAERLATQDEVDFYSRLLQDDHKTIDELSILKGVLLALSGICLGWIYFGAQPTPLNLITCVSLVIVVLLFAHVLPRAYGDHLAESIIIRFMPGVWRLLWLCQPITQPFRWMVMIALRVTGSTAQEDAVEEADDEIRSAAIEAVRDGVLEQSAYNMIEKVIDFRDVEVSEVMTPRIDIQGVSIESSFSEAVELLVSHGHSRLPIFEESIDKIVGIVHIKDIVERLHLKNAPADLSVREVLRKPLFVPESKRVRDLFGDIKSNKVHVAIIVDEYGGTAGMVTLSDIISEIFGDIDDEHDMPEREGIEQLSDATFSVDGKVHIDELNQSLNINLPEDADYDTLGGYLSTNLGKIPSVGDLHHDSNLLFKVVEGDERKVDRIEILIDSEGDQSG
ncbi:MAG: hemolysin family protein [Planctomycetota bacterium]|nr:hemolysin family protein [Planctomycetota bacterium]